MNWPHLVSIACLATEYGGHGKTIQEIKGWTPYQLILFTMEPDKINIPLFPAKPGEQSRGRTQKMSPSEAAEYQRKKQGDKPKTQRPPSPLTQRYRRP